METFSADELTITVNAVHPGRLILNWSGKSNSREPGKTLRPFFESVLRRSTQLQASLELHFEKMENFNSSTIAEVIRLINEARQKLVPLTIHYDGRVKWQALSFEAIRRAMTPFASDARAPVKVVSIGAEAP